MKEIRIHGRGGQGAVVAAELLVMAAFENGSYGQAFPAFGGERRGAPVQAFVRLDDQPVRVRYRVNEPDIVLILDRTLPNMIDVLAGIRPGGVGLIDSEDSPLNLLWSAAAVIYPVPATRIGMEVFGQPLINPAILGALAAATDVITLPALQSAFLQRFPGAMGEKNGVASRMGYEFVRSAGARPTCVQPSGHAFGVPAAWPGEDGLGGPGRPLNFGQVVAPRTALAYLTGGWRYSQPDVDRSRCVGCGICATFCPDGCVRIVNKLAVVDYDYCKGCGICAQVCTRGAIHIVDQSEA